MAMGPITLRLTLFRDDADRQRSERTLLYFLEALAWANQLLLRSERRAGRPIPPLYKAGVRYQPEDGTEEWQDILDTITRGYGDCEDLAAWRVAELRMLGIRAKPYIRYKRRGGRLVYHVLVLLPSGRLEDPSLRLGMGKFSWQQLSA
jgi:hypothetical protein